MYFWNKMLVDVMLFNWNDLLLYCCGPSFSYWSFRLVLPKLLNIFILVHLKENYLPERLWCFFVHTFQTALIFFSGSNSFIRKSWQLKNCQVNLKCQKCSNSVDTIQISCFDNKSCIQFTLSIAKHSSKLQFIWFQCHQLHHLVFFHNFSNL